MVELKRRDRRKSRRRASRDFSSIWRVLTWSFLSGLVAAAGVGRAVEVAVAVGVADAGVGDASDAVGDVAFPVDEAVGVAVSVEAGDAGCVGVVPAAVAVGPGFGVGADEDGAVDAAGAADVAAVAADDDADEGSSLFGLNFVGILILCKFNAAATSGTSSACQNCTAHQFAVYLGSLSCKGRYSEPFTVVLMTSRISVCR